MTHSMKIIKSIPVPTGTICIVQGMFGKLEMLSVGDYGKQVNLKADFLGMTRHLNGVKHTKMLPLTEKWVITISTQYGCSMDCTFCDVPKVGLGMNATTNDMLGQVHVGLSLHPEITGSDRLNIHFARMGEPTWNKNVIAAAWQLSQLRGFRVHPVVSTMMPKNNRNLESFLLDWMEIKNDTYNGNAGLQISVNSTCDYDRRRMFSNSAMKLNDVARLLKNVAVVGRKITLNFAVADYEIDAKKLSALFDPSRFLVKLTPMHKTASCVEAGIQTPGDYTTLAPYQEAEENLKAEGFDVIVFIASREEDEGRITCGNAILSGTFPFDRDSD